MIIRGFLPLVIVFLLSTEKSSAAITWKMKVVSKSPSTTQNFIWNDLPAVMEPTEKITVKGSTQLKETALIKEDAGKSEKLVLDPVGQFQFDLQLAKPITPFRILSIQPSGESQSQEFVVTKEATPGQYAKISRAPKGQQIEGFTLKGEKIRLETALPRPEGHMLLIEGVLLGKNRKLALNNKPVYVSESGDAILLVEVGQTDVQITATDENGQSSGEALHIEYISKPLKPWSIGALAYLVSNKYSQRGPYPFSVEQLLLGAGGEFHYNLVPEKWFIHSSMIMTPMSINNNSTYKLTFLDVEGTLAYQLEILSPEWKLELAVGGLFATTSSSDANLGYQNLMAPQFYPVLRRSLGTNHEISGFLRMVPVSAGNIPTLSERMFTIGVDYRMKFGSEYELLAGLHNTDLNYKPSENTTIESKTTLIKFGIGF